MRTLRDLQENLSRFITGEVPDELCRLVLGDGLEPAARLSIYRNNVLSRLTDALSRTFPVVCKLVERRFFEYAAYTFIQRRLPSHACLAEYGADFSGFLSEFPPASQLKYLPDVARLEWSIGRALHATPMPPIDIVALAESENDPAQIRLVLTPCVRFIASPYAIDDIWAMHQGDDPFTELQLDSSVVHLQVDGAAARQLTRLSQATWKFRAGLADGATLGAAVTAAQAISADFAVASALATLFEDKLVVGLESAIEGLRPNNRVGELV